MLFAACHRSRDTFACKGGFQRLGDFFNQVQAIAPRRRDGPLNQLRPHRVEGAEGQLFQLVLELVHAQSVRDWRIELQRLLGDALLFLPRHHTDRAHVVQPVCQFDQDHTNIARHRHRHFLEAGSLRLGARLEDGLELTDAVHNVGDRSTKAVAHRLLGNGRVFNDVV